MGGFVIEVDDPRRDDVRLLLEQYRMFAGSVMPPDGVHALDPDDALDANITFFSLRVDGELLGIGAIKQLDSDHAELKSMHTAIAARRRGVGRAMVDHLVAVAAARGVRRVSLRREHEPRLLPPRRPTEGHLGDTRGRPRPGGSPPGPRSTSAASSPSSTARS